MVSIPKVKASKTIAKKSQTWYNLRCNTKGKNQKEV